MKQTQQLWIPIILFKNTDNNLETLVDSKATILVKKMGNFTKSSNYEVRDTAYYKGSQNPLEYAREFHYKFNCQFALELYPFDTQTCTILLSKQTRVANFIKLVPHNLTYTGPINLMQFTVLDWKIASGPDEAEYDVVITIVLKRRIEQHLLSTFLPSLCILILAQVRSNIMQ